MILVVDIDNVLSDAMWRDHLALDKRWDEYHSESIKDKPHKTIINLANSLRRAGWTTIGLTGRPERYRALTNDWCIRHDVELDELLMRGNADFRPSPEVKMAIIARRFHATELETLIVLDDRDDIIAKMVAHNINAFHVSARSEHDDDCA